MYILIFTCAQGSTHVKMHTPVPTQTDTAVSTYGGSTQFSHPEAKSCWGPNCLRRLTWWPSQPRSAYPTHISTLMSDCSWTKIT